MVAKRADVIDQRRQLLGERPVELGEGLFDAAYGEGGVDAVKPCLGCVRVVVWNADITGEIVFAAALYKLNCLSLQP